jgi:hypothetical protein
VADLERIQSGRWWGRQGRKLDTGKLEKDGRVGESGAAGSESGELLRIQNVPAEHDRIKRRAGEVREGGWMNVEVRIRRGSVVSESRWGLEDGKGL